MVNHVAAWSWVEAFKTYDPKMPGHRRGVWRRTVLAITPAAEWLGECSTKGGAVVAYELAGAPPPRLRYCSVASFMAWARRP